jgi:hypothetical protein
VEEGDDFMSWARWAKHVKVVWAFCRGFGPSKKDLWAENGEKKRNLNYEFWTADLEFGDDMTYNMS